MPDEKAPSSGAFLPLSLMYFLSGEPMHYLSGVDTNAAYPGMRRKDSKADTGRFLAAASAAQLAVSGLR